MWWRSLAARIGAAARRCDEAVMPTSCVFCGIGPAASICSPCRADLPWVEHGCIRCARPLAAPLPDGVYCGECQRRPPPYSAARAPLRYAFPVDAAIKQLKFRRRLDYVPAFASVLGEAMQELPTGTDALAPVPLHWRRQAARGFNQAEELCKALSRSTGVPMLRNLRRVRPTPYQSGLHAVERRRNLHGAFAVRGAIDQRHVLVVDDVITTGETCARLARVLLDAGAARVSVLAIATASRTL
jgi:ComF family protein